MVATLSRGLRFARGLFGYNYSFPSDNSASAFSRSKTVFFRISCLSSSAFSASFSTMSSASLMCSSASSRFSLSMLLLDCWDI